MESRVVRLEEWAKLSDQRMGRIEDKLDRLVSSVTELAGEVRSSLAELRAESRSSQSEMRATFVTKADLAEDRRHATSTLWTAAGAIVGVLALLFAAYQAWGPKPRANSIMPVQPIIIQTPAASPLLGAPSSPAVPARPSSPRTAPPQG